GAGRAAAAVEALIAEARLQGDVGYAVTDTETGAVLEARAADTALPPASVTKAVTALYALDTLGAGHRFKTRL
ncbi:MAG TPA: D-alanyl-D-alanine carboxypeptidase, partial [Roseovarius sp.]|nr:D-alanyl-D-alanine carboxypeptidase [Roseovarius sp.]